MKRKHDDVIVTGNHAETRDKAAAKFEQLAPKEYARYRAYRSIGDSKAAEVKKRHAEWQAACKEFAEFEDAYGRVVKEMIEVIDRNGGDGRRLYDLLIWGR